MDSTLTLLLMTTTFAPKQIVWNANNSAHWCAFSGNDLTNSLTKSVDCEDLCVSTPDCTHYTWTDYNSGTCFMKKNKVSKSEAFPKYDQNAVCGIVDSSGLYSKVFIKKLRRYTAILKKMSLQSLKCRL